MIVKLIVMFEAEMLVFKIALSKTGEDFIKFQRDVEHFRA